MIMSMSRRAGRIRQSFSGKADFNLGTDAAAGGFATGRAGKGAGNKKSPGEYSAGA